MKKNDNAMQDEAKQLHDHILKKTAFRGVVYFGIAYLITYFYPEQRWAWYFVIAYLIIGGVFAITMKWLQNKP